MMIRNFSTLLMLLVLTPSVFAQTIDYSCEEKTEGEYAYDMEVLMHSYESARVGPKEFESLRERLMVRRDKGLSDCQRNFAVELEHHEGGAPTVYSATAASSDRMPASISSPIPQGNQGFSEAKRSEAPGRGGYIEVGSDTRTTYDEYGNPVYSGDRVSVDN